MKTITDNNLSTLNDKILTYEAKYLTRRKTMKRITKNIAIVVMVCILALSVVALVACKDKTIYTVKVVGIDGKPYVGALVQPCEVESDGKLGMCYSNMVATDENGIAVLTIGKEITNTKADHMEIHLQNLPVYLTYEAPRMRKGDTVTITLETNIKTPSSGTGEGKYVTDKLGNVDLEMNPYVVGEGAYALKFTSATQLIFFEFRTNGEGIYKVYSVGDVDASVTQLTGSKLSGIRNTGDPALTNDNVSNADKNFSYQFEVSPSLFEETKGMNDDIDYAACYFEVSLKNASDVNKETIICFEYVEEYVDEEDLPLQDVHPAKTLTKFDDQEGDYIDADLDGGFKYSKGDDGYYYTESGKLLVATLGKRTKDPQGRSVGARALPQGLDLSIMDIYISGQSLIFREGDVRKNYAPLVEAYTDATNSEGRYPVTDELIHFFTLFITEKYTVDRLENDLLVLLPEGEEWLVWCGFYNVAHEGDGTEIDPFTLKEGNNNLPIPAGGPVYFSANAWVPTTYIIMSDSTNLKVAAYNVFAGIEGATKGESEDMFYFDVVVEGYFIFAFSTIDGSAATISVNVIVEMSELDLPEGSMENPIVMDEFKEYSESTLTENDSPAPVYFTFTATEAITLYFKLGENTVISWIHWTDVDGEDHYYADWQNGLQLPAGAVIKMEVFTADNSEGIVSFTVSDSPID